MAPNKFGDLLAFCLTGLCIGLCSVNAQELPKKTEWRLASGEIEKGRATGFHFDSLVLSMQRNTVYVNGESTDDPGSIPLIRQLSACYSIPIDDTDDLKKFLKNKGPLRGVKGYAARFNYISLKCVNNGQEKRIPIALLAPAEVDELRTIYDEWMAEQARLAKEQNDRQMMLNLQALQTAAAIDAANAADDAADAARRSAEAQKRSADSLEKIEKKIDK